MPDLLIFKWEEVRQTGLAADFSHRCLSNDVSRTYATASGESGSLQDLLGLFGVSLI